MRTKGVGKPRHVEYALGHENETPLQTEPIDDYVTYSFNNSTGLYETQQNNHVHGLGSQGYRQQQILRWKQKKKIRCPTSENKMTPPLELDLQPCLLPTSNEPVLQTCLGMTPSSSRKSNSKGRALLACISEEPDTLKSQPDCIYCGAKKFVHETVNFCCSGGTVSLVSNKLPQALRSLLNGADQDSTQFNNCIRTYNNHLAFTSLGVTCDKNLSKRNQGIYTFRVQGQVYHFINDLVAGEQRPKNLQFYFHDTECEISSRIEDCPRLLQTVLEKLLAILNENPYARFFRSLHHYTNLQEREIILYCTPLVDQRVYNKPTVPQVAAILELGESEEKTERNIRVYTHGGHSRSIGYYYGCYDPLQYPLLFPYGDLGWHQGIKKKGVNPHKPKRKTQAAVVEQINPQNVVSAHQLLDQEHAVLNAFVDDPDNVSVREYYAYKLQIRDNDESCLLHFGRLFQQYTVDMFVKMETQRLDFYRSQQDDIRSDFLQGLADAFASGEKECGKVGHRTILPGSFIGGPRHMKRKYLDAMTLVQKFGKPDLFLTITSNPNWPEIKKHLSPGEQAQDRPDLIVRAFHSKLEELENELFKKNVFGEVAAYTYVIEFQKRGLPHAHFLLILKPQYKLFRPEEFDTIVSTELPDKQHPHLYKLVVKHMLHGPCGQANPTNVCMTKHGVCRNSYPKDFCPDTLITADAYPTYRRRDDGKRVKVRGAWLDNRWIVPYSAYLLAKFDCHINVEICSTIKAIKYIYKYICKGSDKIMYNVIADKAQDSINEIDQYASARWVSPPESLWRIYRFTMSEMKPAVIHLQCHLENYQPVVFKKKETIRNVLQNPCIRKTMLTEFFNMNRTSKDAQELNCTYSEFPDHFVWLPDKKMWKLRQRGNSIGRIVLAHPTEGERYYLRLLLSKVRCPTSFEDLKKYNNIVVETYYEAALNRGLLAGDNSQDLCLTEASAFHMPYELRRLFATLLVYACPNEPRKLWLKFEHDMSEDLLKRKELSQHKVRWLVLQQIDGFLKSMGKDINKYNIISGNINYYDVHDLTRELIAEKNVIVTNEDLRSQTSLNENQQQAFDVITQRLSENKPGAFFIDGPGGTGKTFLYRALLADVRSKGNLALATATSGIAASLLHGGRTAHSQFKIPIDISDGGTCRVNKQTSLAHMIKEAKLIIWDEASMSKRTALEALDDLLQDLMDSTETFGGKVVVLGGDFRQTLPVVRKGTKAETINASLISSTLWPKLERFQLTQNMRAKLDPAFTKFLLKIREGLGQVEDSENISLPPQIMLQPSKDGDGLEDLINVVYPDIHSASCSPANYVTKAILTTKNQFVDEVNELLIKKFPGDEMEYLSYDETSNPQDQGQYEDLLNSLTPNGLPPHRLILKKNSPIIFLRNLDPTEGLCNGTRLICQSQTRNIIHAKIVVGDFSGKEDFIHRIPLEPPNNDFSCTL